MKEHSIFFELKDFLILWSSQSVSELGTAMTNYALILWAYRQQGTAMSITLLSVCSYVPYILFGIAAGTLADRWDKKKVMLASDSIAALGTLTIFILYGTDSLQVWHLYLINFFLSFMNAFQNPAAYVAETLIIPEKYYAKTSGLQAFSSSLVTILAPALATVLLSFFRLPAVLTADLLSFAAAFFCLRFLVRIPQDRISAGAEREPFFQNLWAGLAFLREHRIILHFILFFSFANLLAFLGESGSMLSVLVLARSGGDQVALGTVTSFVGIGALAGSVLATAARPAKSRTKVIFLCCAFSFLCDIPLALGRSAAVWAAAVFVGNLLVPPLNANLTVVMRTKIPVGMQGRVLSVRSALQYFTIPLGLCIGGILSDKVLEPFMRKPSAFQHLAAAMLGTGNGSGTAIIFLFTGTLGFLAGWLCLKSPRFRELDS